MKISEQILLKRYIIDNFLVGSEIKINNEAFSVTKYSKNDGLLRLSRMIYFGSGMKSIGSFVAIDNVSFTVAEDNGKILSLDIYCVILHGAENTLIIFDEDLSPIEKKFILEDYPVGFEFEMDGATFLVVNNNEEEIILRPTMNNLWYKTNEESTKCRFIENGEIVEKSL
ncbi:MAG TPA: hypothetical protein VIK86_09280 [Candidatus Paceibacterota bacterium]